MQLLGWLTTLAFAFCYWPQLYKTWKRKTVGDISVWPWFIQSVGYATGIAYGALLHQWPLLVGYIHGLLCSLLFLVLYYKYKHNIPFTWEVK